MTLVFQTQFLLRETLFLFHYTQNIICVPYSKTLSFFFMALILVILRYLHRNDAC